MLLVYLGGEKSSAILPYGQEERVKAAFGEKSNEVLSACQKIIEALKCCPDVLSKGDLREIAESVSQRAQAKFSWLDPIVAEKLGSYYSYQQR